MTSEKLSDVVLRHVPNRNQIRIHSPNHLLFLHRHLHLPHHHRRHRPFHLDHYHILILIQTHSLSHLYLLHLRLLLLLRHHLLHRSHFHIRIQSHIQNQNHRLFHLRRRRRHHHHLLLLLLFPSTGAAASCPIDFSFTSAIPWDSAPCFPSADVANITYCCQTLLSLIGVAFSIRLRSTSLFRLPDVPTSAACLSSFQSSLPSGLPSTLVQSCFPSPARFVASNRSCAAILSRQDWSRRLPGDLRVERACAGDLSGTACLGCVDAGTAVSSDLLRIDGNSSNFVNCFYLVVIYAGAINLAGPTNEATARCVYGMQLLAPQKRSLRRAVLVSSIVLIAAAFLVGVLGLYLWRRRRTEKEETWELPSAGSETSRRRPNIGPVWYDIKTIRHATGDFAEMNLIGRGGSGAVYRGVLPDGTVVAVKRVEEAEEDEADFRNEVAILSGIRHRNLVPLRGFCITHAGPERYLVYEYMPNGTLHDRLFRELQQPLTWLERRAVILDVARGLAYLHYGVRPAIFHRDVKATNILLDGDMCARVADFGLARRGRLGASYATNTRVAGTHGYLAPEYVLYGQLTEKSDVYSFGVVLLEVMAGRKALEMSEAAEETLLSEWAWARVMEGSAREVIDATLLANEGNPIYVMERFVQVGILCSHIMVALRPTIIDALKMLEGDVEVPPIPSPR